jgi:hypothetical protein
VSLDSLLKPTVIAEATTAVKDAFARCDPAKFDDCVNHPYSAPSSSSTFYLTLPGYGRVGYSKYVFSLVADPTNDINLVLGAGPGQVTASGTCATTLTVDDSKTYTLKGDYTALLTWNGRTFGAEVTGACDRDKA